MDALVGERRTLIARIEQEREQLEGMQSIVASLEERLAHDERMLGEIDSVYWDARRSFASTTLMFDSGAGARRMSRLQYSLASAAGKPKSTTESGWSSSARRVTWLQVRTRSTHS